MRINIKQQQLFDEMFHKVKFQFPEIVYKNLEVSLGDPEHIWIKADADMDEYRETMIRQYAAELQTDILLDYGYMFSIMTDNPNTVYS